MAPLRGLKITSEQTWGSPSQSAAVSGSAARCSFGAIFLLISYKGHILLVICCWLFVLLFIFSHISNLWVFLTSCFSNQSKQAFADWARHDDAQDHFCELDGENPQCLTRQHNTWTSSDPISMIWTVNNPVCVCVRARLCVRWNLSRCRIRGPAAESGAIHRIQRSFSLESLEQHLRGKLLQVRRAHTDNEMIIVGYEENRVMTAFLRNKQQEAKICCFHKWNNSKSSYLKPCVSVTLKMSIININLFLVNRPRSVYRPLNPLAPSRGEAEIKSITVQFKVSSAAASTNYERIRPPHLVIEICLQTSESYSGSWILWSDKSTFTWFSNVWYGKRNKVFIWLLFTDIISWSWRSSSTYRNHIVNEV